VVDIYWCSCARLVPIYIIVLEALPEIYSKWERKNIILPLFNRISGINSNRFVLVGESHITMKIHTDKFPQRSFVANATSLTLLQFAGDFRR